MFEGIAIMEVEYVFQDIAKITGADDPSDEGYLDATHDVYLSVNKLKWKLHQKNNSAAALSKIHTFTFLLLNLSVNVTKTGLNFKEHNLKKLLPLFGSIMTSLIAVKLKSGASLLLEQVVSFQTYH